MECSAIINLVPKQSLFAAENFSDQKESFQRFEYSLLLQVSSGSSITSRLELPGRMLTLPMRISQDTLSKTKLEKKNDLQLLIIYIQGNKKVTLKWYYAYCLMDHLKLCCLPIRMELERCREYKAMLFTNKNGTKYI